MQPIRITTDDTTEQHTVTNATRDDDGTWRIHGLDPSETDILGPDLAWLSGSLGGPELQTNDHGEPRFPSVTVPPDHPATIELLTHHD